MPHILQAVNARAPIKRAPPTPPTTPPMIFLDDELRPELPLLCDCANADGVTLALVVTEMTVLLVLVPVTVLPPWTSVYVWTICEVALVTNCE